MSPGETSIMNADEVLEWIPHRPPFLYIDEVVELSDDRIVTRVGADPEAPFFQGHYPGNPVMPGVLICECTFQAGALLAVRRLGKQVAAGATPVLTRINEAKFRRIVRPGQILQVEVTLDEVLDDAFFMTGRVTVEGKPVLRVTFVCMLDGGD